MANLGPLQRWLRRRRTQRGKRNERHNATGVAGHYDRHVQYEWDRLDHVPMEFELTLRALREALPPAPARIADVGCGPGRYSIELARAGYAVTLVDLSAACLSFAADKARASGVRFDASLQASAVDLSPLSDANFDAVLLLGPLYHLIDHADRVRALAEARRLLRPGGVLFAAFLSRYSAVQFLLAQRPEALPHRRADIDEALRTGVWRSSASDTAFPDAWLAHPDDIPPLIAEAGFPPGKLLAVQPLATYAAARLKHLPLDLRTQWFDLLYRLAPEPNLHGASDHLLYVTRKTA